MKKLDTSRTSRQPGPGGESTYVVKRGDQTVTLEGRSVFEDLGFSRKDTTAMLTEMVNSENFKPVLDKQARKALKATADRVLNGGFKATTREELQAMLIKPGPL